MQERIAAFNRQFETSSIEEVLNYFTTTYNGRIGFSSSFGAEDQVLTDILVQQPTMVKIFTLDTGRLPYETYDVMDKTNKKYGITIDVYTPERSDLETLYSTQGINGFYDSIENRKACCHVRKIAPLQRALRGLDVWITGLRQSQSVTRDNLELLEYDEQFQLIKLNPLARWSETEVWDYIHQNHVPYNALHDKGYPSIGCAPCTRSIAVGEDIRAGRWWWEKPEHKECGLHAKTA
ncbi:MAG: phosphoadenylyl-sulfate reductase [Sulfurimonas sp.]|nr:MAG: phosphoadenylyl-sulfate reductase [Sulfurimonas sp.]